VRNVTGSNYFCQVSIFKVTPSKTEILIFKHLLGKPHLTIKIRLLGLQPMTINKIIYNIILLIFFAGFCSTDLRAFNYGNHPSESQTRFSLYATEASSVSVRVYENEGFTDYSMQKVDKNDSQLSGELVKDSWEYVHPEDLTGKSYHYIIKNENHIPSQLIDYQTVEVGTIGVDLFLFDRDKGYLVDTSSKGFLVSKVDNQDVELSGKIIKKIVGVKNTVFKIKAGYQIEDYFLQLSTEGEFPKRIENYPTAEPYCLDLLNNNACVIRPKPSRKVKRIGFKRGHTIHEVHLKDLTFLLDDIPAEIRGTYKAISHPQTLKVLESMQVSTLEFLPLHSFDRSAAPPGHINYWGYMTRGFFALHRAYASDPSRTIEEFQEAVEALHSVGISVIMDVVYNHTSEGDHRGPTVSFKNLARDKYFRMWDAQKGYYLNSTGVGNTCKTESEVMRQLILDSLTYFSDYFGIDGYRFDLGAAIDKQTLREIRAQLPKDTLLTAEPWVAADGAHWGRKDLNEIGLGKWSDGYRQDVRGGSGNSGWINGQGNENSIKVLLRGEDERFGGSGSFVFASPGDINHLSVINEVEVHDGYTLYDWIKNLKVSEDILLARMRLAHTLLMVSVQTPILQLGQEFGRTKKGDKNSYDKDSEINWIDWKRADEEPYKQLNDFTTSLKKLRLHYDAFHFNKRIDDERLLFINDKSNNDSAFGVIMKGSKYEFLVLLNGSDQYGAEFRFYNTVYDLVSNGEKISPRGLSKVQGGHYYLNPYSSAILRRKLPSSNLSEF
tara:strand:+ start:3978 stop:6308 length:2331 start_codon:yes stop_codon:yes gene_type:complete